MNENPKVAVCMLAYNHEAFVAEAIESVIGQQTAFPVKLFVGEDNSSDRTRQICLQYREKYPEKIELILNQTNLGMMPNFVNTLRKCFDYGDYTAICEGDDFWTDADKLQKQIDFLEANPDFAVCFHRVKIQFENGTFDVSNHDQKDIAEFEDLAGGNFIHTPSVVFRNGLFARFPAWMNKAPMGDWILHLLNAQTGKIKFVDETMATYRVHSGGIWSLTGEKRIWANTIKAVEFCRRHFAPRGREQFDHVQAVLGERLCTTCFEAGLYDEYREYYPKCQAVSARIKPNVRRNLTLRYLLSFSPPLADLYKMTTRRLKGSPVNAATGNGAQQDV